MGKSGFGLTLLTIGLAACEFSPPYGGDRVGVIVIESEVTSGEFRAAPSATFWRSTLYQPDAIAVDTCFMMNLGNPQYGPVGSDRWNEVGEAGVNTSVIDGGQYIVIASPTASDTMTFGYHASGIGYRLNGSPFLNASPGDSVVIAVSGHSAGFPPALIRAQLGEPYQLDTVPTSPGEVALTIEWDAAPEAGARMIVVLPFSSIVPPHPNPGINSAIYCSFPDTGVAIVPSNVMAYWRATYAEHREVYSSRVRFARVDLGPKTRLHVVSTHRGSSGNIVPD